MSFRVHAGEVLGIAGLMGAGRTEVLEDNIWSNSWPTGKEKFFLSGEKCTDLTIHQRLVMQGWSWCLRTVRRLGDFRKF